MNREQRRAVAKQAGKDGNKQLQEKISLFGKLPDECLTCEKPFDKKDRDMVMSWNVVVHGDQEVVRLYCPECWDKAIKITEDFKRRLEEKYGEVDEGA
mgnify:FL=1|tara:strand:- start:943 stop:1236 length:294 start_codon:yes stop_codon:yes gene_type:complete